MEAKTFLVVELFLLIISAVGGGWWWSLFVLGTLLLGYKAYSDMVAGSEADKMVHTCPECGTVGAYQLKTHTREARTEGIVMRKATRKMNGVGYGGQPSSEYSVEEREERVPVIKTTRYMQWECSSCGHRDSEESIVDEGQVEDFERPIYQPRQVVTTNHVIERERMRVPCRFCGVYVDPLANRTCPSCGSAIK